MKRITLHKSLFLFAFCLMAISAHSQGDRPLFFLRNMPQSKWNNPSFFPDYRFYVGVPLISSLKIGVDNTYSFNDIFLRRSDSLILDRDHLMSRIRNNNSTNFDLRLEYFSFGFKIRDNYFAFRVAEDANFNLNITRETLKFLVYGNGSNEYLGKTVKFDGNALNQTYFREYTVGYSRKIDDRLSMGINFKYLQGISSVDSEKIGLQLYTDSTDYTLRIRSDIKINTSLPGNEKLISPYDFLPGKSNPGLAFDFGASYLATEKLSLSAGVVNIGAIQWRDNLKNFRSAKPNNEFVYSGFDLESFLDDGVVSSDALNQMLDSIQNELGIKEVREHYRTVLPSRIFFSAQYEITPSHYVGLLYHYRMLKHLNWNTFTASYIFSHRDRLQLVLYNTLTPGSFINPGAAVSFHAGPVQLALAGENVLAPLMITRTKFFSFQFLLNFTIKGKKSSNDEIPLSPEGTTE